MDGVTEILGSAVEGLHGGCPGRCLSEHYSTAWAPPNGRTPNTSEAKQIGDLCRLKGSGLDKRPAGREAEIVDPLSGGARVAVRGADIFRNEVPGTAAVHMVCALAAFDPGRTIRRRAIVIAVEAILDPLKDIADHVVEAERIGLE